MPLVTIPERQVFMPSEIRHENRKPRGKGWNLLAEYPADADWQPTIPIIAETWWYQHLKPPGPNPYGKPGWIRLWVR